MKKISVMAVVFVSLASFAMADGAAIFDAKCKKCHGEKGEGSEKALEKLCKGYKLEELRIDLIKDKTDEEVRKIIAEGKEKMPAYAEKLTADEINEVVAFCRTLVK
jgi:cytochrome c6